MVYTARDTRLDRIVVIKVLPPDQVADTERKRRFIQEAKAASALNHPNIITIYDADHDDGVDFIAMEHVLGQTLDQLIPPKGLRLSEALQYAVQIADALAAAHRAGIVHRDLKPANVMITEQGRVKVLDFGLAKPVEQTSTGDDTLTQALKPTTKQGTILGTVDYMSPEQAQGKVIDPRSDIFSFGSLLYEMVTGRRAFQGESTMSTLASIITLEPARLPREIPHDLEKVINRCMRKDPARRFQTMADLKVALQELKEEADSGKPTVSVAAGAPPVGLRFRLMLAAALVLASVAALTLWRSVLFREALPPVLAAVPLTSYPGWEGCPSFSPDGTQVAFAWNGEKQDNYDIYVKVIDSGKPLRLTTDPGEDQRPAWSPDGRFIAFFRESRGKSFLLLISPLGGAEHTIAEYDYLLPTEGAGLAWTPDGKWLAYPERASREETPSLVLLSPTTGEKRALTTAQGRGIRSDVMPAFSPDGRALAFVRRVAGGVGDLWLLALSDDMTPNGQPQRLTFENQYVWNPVWTADGREVVYSSGSVVSRSLRRISPGALLFGSQAGTRKGEQIMLPGEIADTPAISGARHRLVYARSAVDTNIWRADLTADGDLAGRRPLIASTRLDHNPRFSPDGKRIVFVSDRSGKQEVWKCDGDGSNPEQLTSLGADITGCPRWSPDGKQMVFDSNATGQFEVYVMSADGGAPRRLTSGDKVDNAVASWSRDGRFIYFVSNKTGSWQIWRMTAAGENAIQLTRNGGHVAFESSDGKFIYYTRTAAISSLYRMPAGGGPETKVLDALRPFCFQLTDKGVYWIGPADPNGNSQLQFAELKTGKMRSIMSISRPVQVGLTVSPNGRTILYTQVDQSGSDLMLVENFR